MSRLNGRTNTAPHHHRGQPTAPEIDFEPSCLVRTPSGTVYIPPGMPKGTLDYKSNLSHDAPSKTEFQKSTDSYLDQRIANYGVGVPVLPIRNNLQHSSSSHTNYSSHRFHFEKGFTSKCSWKCTSILFILISLLFAFMLIYLTTSNMLQWSSQSPTACEVFVDGNSKALTKIDDNVILTNYSTPSTPVVGRVGGGGGHRNPSQIIPPDGTTFTVMKFGEKQSNEIAPFSYWNMQFFQSDAAYIKFEYEIPRGSSIAVYGRRNGLPTHTQYHMMELLNGLKSRTTRASYATVNKNLTHYLEPGHWFLSLYNDNAEPAAVTLIASISDDMTENCPAGCNGHGSCILGRCRCNAGFGGDDCSHSVCPVLCNQKGEYVNGECHCDAGWKGKDCSLRHDECEIPDCNSHGQCVNGRCECARGYRGKFCAEVDCPHPTCNGHGSCLGGTCVCKKGWKGVDCNQVDQDALKCLPSCSGHGKFDLENQKCTCEPMWTGDDCSREVCDVDCGPHGHCVGDSCSCNTGWSGEYCNVKLCDARCNEHGQCKNGTCLCVTGWNGKHCTLEGCPSSCSGHGQCKINSDNMWECRCAEGWDGLDCNTPLEIDCSDNQDNDQDGLTDCEDPECCSSDACHTSQLCVSAPKPIDILLRKQPPVITASFFEKSRFLIEEGSLQNYARQDSFNESRAAIVRGRVVTNDGVGLMGVRVSTSTPLEGFTLTRDDGWFDLLVNGGGSVGLQFGRSPFKPQYQVIYVPWNEIVIMEPVVMSFAEEKRSITTPQTCRSHDYSVMKPVVLATWKHNFQGGCSDKSAILAESQTVQESIQIPGTGLNLVYHSSRSAGYLTTIQLQLTPETIPTTLKLIHLKIAIEGTLFEKKFEADPNIRYTYAWNRLNVYRQKVYGVITALVKVGYEYTDCRDIMWDAQTTKLSGNDMSISEVGGWNLDIHHRYNFHEGILQKGDGSNIYLKHKPRIIRSTVGDGHQRSLECKDCNNKPGEETRVLSPATLAAASDGSIFMGDFNLIRRIMNDGTVRTLARLNVTRVSYRYHIAVSPLDGTVYISDSDSHLILKLKDTNSTTDPVNNWENAIGAGERCLPGDEAHCGDGAHAKGAKLSYPKGLAVSADNVLYFADGTNIRTMDKDGIVRTIIGNHMHKSHWKPMPCEGIVNAEEAHLRWPTSISINPIDNSLYIIDDHMVLKLTSDGRLRVVAGRPLHCPPHENIDPEIEFATQTTLVAPQSIAFAPNGDLYIAESDTQRINRIRVVGTDGRISHFAGSESKCNCMEYECDCKKEGNMLAAVAKFKAIPSITVTPDGVVHVADQANYRIRSIMSSLPQETKNREYEVYSPERQELYVFNRFGQHIATKNILTGESSYTFTYSVNTSNGKLSTVTDTADNKIFLLRDYSSQVNSIENTRGQKCRLKMSRMRMLSELTTPDNYNVTLDYHRATGLLWNKLDSAGRSYIYNYDEFGRLISALTPTGKAINLAFDLSMKGAMVKVNYDEKRTVTMRINGPSVVTKIGESEWRSASFNNGTITSTMPWGATHTTEVIPYLLLGNIDPVLAQSYPVPAKQKTELGTDVAGRYEWKYFVGEKGPKLLGRKLNVFGNSILTFKYDQETRSVSVIMDDTVELLNVTYDRTARPVKWTPTNGGFASVELEYDRFRRLSVWKWGSLNEKYNYDRSGRLSEIHYADDTSTLYTFKDMFSSLPIKVTTPRGSDYLLEYDDGGALKSMTTPRGHIHSFSLQSSLGFYKYQYYSPISRHPFELRFNEEGQILEKIYPRHSGKVTYIYDPNGRISTILTGLSSTHYTYQENTNLIKNIDTREPGFELKHEFKYHFGLIQEEKFTYGIKTNFHNTQTKYTYDGNARVSIIESTIHNTKLEKTVIKYGSNYGLLEAIGDLRLYRTLFNRSIIQNTKRTYMMITEYDAHARIKIVNIRIAQNDVFKMELDYDNRGRIGNKKFRIGETEMIDRMKYSADGHLIEVDGDINHKYIFDENGNAIATMEQEQRTSIIYDSADRVAKVGAAEINSYDERGFVISRGTYKLSYDDCGHLSFSSSDAPFNTFYRYDSKDRLIGISNGNGSIMQMLYTDPYKSDLITIVYYPKDGRVINLYYDDNSILFALDVLMERTEVASNRSRFYVAVDQTGSPIAIFNVNGSVVKEIRRTPSGRIISDSNPNLYIPVDFHGAVPDPYTKLLYLNKRWYDPYIGQWMTPDWEKLANKMTAATDIFIYRFHNNDPINSVKSQTVNYMTDMNSWMQVYGYNTHKIFISSYLQDVVKHPVAQVNSPNLAPDFGVVSGLRCIVDKMTDQFKDLSFIPQQLLKMESSTRNLLPRVAYRRAVFGEGLLVTRMNDGRALISTIDGVNSILQDVVSTVFNYSYFLDVYFSHRDQDLFYFVKDNPLKIREDVEQLKRLGGMFNVSTHDAVGSSDGKELRLHSSEALITIRYGVEPHQEKLRLLKHAHKRAVERAWELEKALVMSGLTGSKDEWSSSERDELIQRGKVSGYDGQDIYNVLRNTELAEEPGNIIFKKESGKRKRKRRNHGNME